MGVVIAVTVGVVIAVTVGVVKGWQRVTSEKCEGIKS